jgi:glycosyltransferase involved in cell wall biosynthesis
MRFLLAGHFYGRGGIQTHLCWLGRTLAGDGHTVALLPTLPAQPGEVLPADLEKVVAAVYTPAAPPTGWLGKVRHLAGAARFVRRFRPHVYYVVGVGWIPTVLRPLAAPGARAIFFEVMSGNWYCWTDPRVLTPCCFDEVVGQSPRVGAEFRRSFRWRRPVASLPAFPEPIERIADVPAAVRRRVPLGRARAALFGRLAPHKRALWLVRHWDELQPFLGEMHIHGAGPDEQPIRDLLRARDFGGRVVCHGPYPSGTAFVDLLRSYDLTLLPTVGDEGAPLVLLESMACGVPFVASAAGGVADYGRGNPNCLVARLQPDEFLASVRHMADRLDRGLIDQRQVQRYYHTYFGHDALCRHWLDYVCHPAAPRYSWPGNG